MAAPAPDTPSSVLAVYAHPDDPEVSCGGTLARWAAAGAEVHVVVCAAGDKGSSDPAARPEELARRRAAEVEAANAV
ncbi:MAG: PIG-L deacetylase family protein, partial [Acidimicrobiia bacterium]